MQLTPFDTRLHMFIRDVWQKDHNVKLYVDEVAVLMRTDPNQIMEAMDKLFKVQVSTKVKLNDQIIVCEKPLVVGKEMQNEDGISYRFGTIASIDWEDFELGICN